MVEANYDPGETLNKKIRNAQLAQFNFILGKKIANFRCFCILQLKLAAVSSLFCLNQQVVLVLF